LALDIFFHNVGACLKFSRIEVRCMEIGSQASPAAGSHWLPDLQNWFPMGRLRSRLLHGTKRNDGMLVCIIQGALVLISRRRKLNSAAPDLSLP
jgi:hypothetical protein